MAKMTKEELTRRKAELRSMASEEVTKREFMQFRIDARNIERLYEVAAQQKKPVGSMVREWVLERLEQECVPEAVKADLTAIEQSRQQQWDIDEKQRIEKRFEVIEKRLDEAHL